MGGRTRALGAAALIDGDINQDAPGFHAPKHFTRDELGRPRAGHKNRTNQQVHTGQKLNEARFARIECVGCLHSDIEKSHAFEIDLEDRHVRSKSCRHARGIDSAGAAAQNHHASGKNSGNTAKQHALATIVLGEEVTANEHGHSPGDFAHRFQQRQAVIDFYGFVGNARGPGCEQTLGEWPVGSEMEISEENLTFAEQIALGCERLFDLHDQISGGKDFLVCRSYFGPGSLIVAVVKTERRRGIALRQPPDGRV